MTVRAFKDGDLVTRGAMFYTGYQPEEVGQNVRTRLKMFLNEWFLDIEEGTPWWPENDDAILGKSTTLASKEATIKRRILLTPGLAYMTGFSLEFDRPSRRLTVSCDIISQSGASLTLSESIDG